MDKKEQRDILKWILGQAYRAEAHKKQTERRLLKVRQEIDNPIGAIRYSSMPKAASGRNKEEELIADLTELEAAITEQMKIIAGAKLRVMEIIEFVPVQETARQILELRHIDFMDWYEISEEMHMSRKQCAKYHRDALDTMTGYRQIQQKIEAAKPEYDKWEAGKLKKEVTQGYIHV